MDKEQILTFLDNDFVTNSVIYFNDNIPNQIGNAIYMYGDNDILELVAFIDSSMELDGSKGMIITTDKIYFQFDTKGCFSYDSIIKLSLENSKSLAYITTDMCKYSFDNSFINNNKFIELLAAITNLKVEMILTNHEKVAYYVPIILDDIINDEYEDITLTNQDQQKIKNFYYELELIKKLDYENQIFELEQLCNQALDFFNALALDSEEIDILLKLQKQFNDKNNEDEESFKGAEKYYDDMMNKYQKGDPDMLNQIKGVMKTLGIDEQDLEGKSPAELNQYIENLCSRFGISKSQIEKLSKKFKL
ncbi:MAG: hypothetical protein ACLR9T_03115 [Thomasclavelia sp.]|uniref:hypothetical protein n=1 Tax=Thomasclavelia sp. TaxID=3025757 RepID=UPI0039A0F6EB